MLKMVNNFGIEIKLIPILIALFLFMQIGCSSENTYVKQGFITKGQEISFSDIPQGIYDLHVTLSINCDTTAVFISRTNMPTQQQKHKKQSELIYNDVNLDAYVFSLQLLDASMTKVKYKIVGKRISYWYVLEYETEPNNSSNFPTEITVSSIKEYVKYGSVFSKDDIDWYSVKNMSFNDYYFTVSMSKTDPMYFGEIYNSSKRKIGSIDNRRNTMKLEHGEFIFIKISAVLSRLFAVPYIISIVPADSFRSITEIEPNNDSAHYNLINIKSKIKGYIASDDTDIYKLIVENDSFYTIGFSVNEPGMILELESSLGVMYKTKSITQGGALKNLFLYKGEYLLKITSSQSVVYDLSFEEGSYSGEIEPNDSTQYATELTDNALINGSLSWDYDKDIYLYRIYSGRKMKLKIVNKTVYQKIILQIYANNSVKLGEFTIQDEYVYSIDAKNSIYAVIQPLKYSGEVFYTVQITE